MSQVTDYKCVDGAIELQSDAFGNNAAFACPECKHPVLMLTHDGNQRGMSQGNPAKCRKCHREFWLERIDDETKSIHIQSKKSE